jgi:hypothetical protein
MWRIIPNRYSHFVLLVMAFLCLPSAASAQVSITSAKTSGAPNWTAWEYYYIQAEGTHTGAYYLVIEWGYFDGDDNHELGRSTFYPSPLGTWSNNYLQARPYNNPVQGGTYYIDVSAFNVMGQFLGSVTHPMTLTAP